MPPSNITSKELQLLGASKNLRIGLGTPTDKIGQVVMASFRVDHVYESFYIYDTGTKTWKWFNRIPRGYKVFEPHDYFDKDFDVNVLEDLDEQINSYINP